MVKTLVFGGFCFCITKIKTFPFFLSFYMQFTISSKKRPGSTISFCKNSLTQLTSSLRVFFTFHKTAANGVAQLTATT